MEKTGIASNDDMIFSRHDLDPRTERTWADDGVQRRFAYPEGLAMEANLHH